MNSADKQWVEVLESKINDLELIASWASMVQYWAVRDNIREATALLKGEIERLKQR